MILFDPTAYHTHTLSLSLHYFFPGILDEFSTDPFHAKKNKNWILIADNEVIANVAASYMSFMSALNLGLWLQSGVGTRAAVDDSIKKATPDRWLVMGAIAVRYKMSNTK